MSIQEKFEKAVNVIRNLPKNGSYQPSHELQLRFYAYYKQATEGYNYHPRPSFWEVVKRAKWDAWAKLGNMTKDEAMLHYVEELRKIVETMSYTDNVASFLSSLDDFYENVPPEDLEMLVGPIIEKMRSRPNSPLSGSPLASRDTSPSRENGLSRDTSPMRLNTNNKTHKSKHITSSLETSPASSYSASPLPPDTDEEEEEHFLDTQTEPDRGKDGSYKKSRVDGLPPEEHISVHNKDLLRPPHPASSYQGKINGELPNSEVTLLLPDTLNSTLCDMRKEMDQMKGLLYGVGKPIPNKSKQAAMCTTKADVARSEQELKSSSGTCTATSDAFKRAIENITKDIENLQRRMTVLETRRQQETPFIRKRSGAMVARWWGIPVRTTVILLAWPLVLLLITKWASSRRRH